MVNKRRQRRGRKSRRPNKRTGGNVRIFNHAMTGVVTNVIKFAYYTVPSNGTIIHNKLELVGNPFSQIWKSYKVNYIEIEVPAGLQIVFRVANTPVTNNDEFYASPFTVYSNNYSSERVAHRYKPVETPYTAWQEFGQTNKFLTGLDFAYCWYGQDLLIDHHVLIVRFGVSLTDQLGTNRAQNDDGPTV